MSGSDKSGKRTSGVGGVKGVIQHPVEAAMLNMVNNWRTVVGFYVISIAAGALVFDLVEKGRSYWDGVWWAFITALTIGYGDVYPVTVTGRITGIILAHLVILIIVPLIIAHMTLKMIKNEHEFTDTEQKRLMADVAETRAQVTVLQRQVAALMEHFGVEAVAKVLAEDLADEAAEPGAAVL